MLNRAEETAETPKRQLGNLLFSKENWKKTQVSELSILNTILQTNYLKCSIKIEEMTMAICDICFNARYPDWMNDSYVALCQARKESPRGAALVSVTCLPVPITVTKDIQILGVFPISFVCRRPYCSYL